MKVEIHLDEVLRYDYEPDSKDGLVVLPLRLRLAFKVVDKLWRWQQNQLGRLYSKQSNAIHELCIKEGF